MALAPLVFSKAVLAGASDEKVAHVCEGSGAVHALLLHRSRWQSGTAGCVIVPETYRHAVETRWRPLRRRRCSFRKINSC